MVRSLLKWLIRIISPLNVVNTEKKGQLNSNELKSIENDTYLMVSFEWILNGIFSFYSYILIAVAMLAIALASGVTAAESKFTKMSSMLQIQACRLK